MGKVILVDTDIIIKSYRGDKEKYRQLSLLQERFCISVITAFELLNGAKNIRQSASVKKDLKSYPVIHINEQISVKAFQLFSKYSLGRDCGVADLLIAATAVVLNYPLYTDNKRHYDFINDLNFYDEKG